MESRDSIADRFRAASDWASEVQRITVPAFRDGVGVDLKSDGTPVTAADRDAERFLRQRIREAFPDDSIEGEEHGLDAGTSPYTWLIDPIDGTMSFARGVPLWGTLIAVEATTANGSRRVVAGVADFPALGHRLAAIDGAAPRWDGPQGCRTPRSSACTQLSNAVVCTSGSEYFVRTGRVAAWSQLATSAAAVRGWSDCYGLFLLATGRVDAVVEPLMHPWDVGPFAVILPACGVASSGFPTHRSGSLLAAATRPLLSELRAAIEW